MSSAAHRKKNGLLVGQRQEVFDKYNPSKDEVEESDEDESDDLYDESGDEDEAGWSEPSSGDEEDSETEDSSDEGAKTNATENTAKNYKESDLFQTLKEFKTQPTKNDAPNEIEKEIHETSKNQEKTEEQDEEEEEEKEVESKKEIEMKEDTKDIEQKENGPSAIISKENSDKEMKEEGELEKKKEAASIPVTRIDSAPIPVDLRTPVLSLETPKNRKKEDDGGWQNAQLQIGKRSDIVLRDSSDSGVLPPAKLELSIKRRNTHRKNARSADFTRSGTLKEREKQKPLKTRLAFDHRFAQLATYETDIESPHVPITELANRNLESELGIEVESPGIDYYYSQADLKLLQEMEEREAMKAALQEKGKSGAKPERKKRRSDFSSLVRNRKTEELKFDLDEYNNQLALVQKEKEKFRSENLLSESQDLPHSIRFRNLTINELVSTERDFKYDMEVIMDLFFDPLSNKNIVDHQTLTSIFSNFKVIYSVSEATLKKFEATIHHPDGPKVSSCFSEIIKYHKMYSDYCNANQMAGALVASLMKKHSAFRQCVEESQNHPRCNGMPFSSYLIKPVQRICKYPLLLRELLKHETEEEEKEHLQKVFDDISGVVAAINENKRAAENMNKILSIQKHLTTKTVELMLPGRLFVKEGILEEPSKHGDRVHVYYALFNDMIIRAEKKKNKKFSSLRKAEKMNLTDHGMLYSIKIRNITDDSSKGFANAFEVQFTSSAKYIVCCPSLKQKQEWLDSLRTQIMKLQEMEGPSAPVTVVTSPKPEPKVEHVSPTKTASMPTEVALGRKVKCFLDKGTPQQRIRKIQLASLSSTLSVEDLFQNIRSEFEWEEGKEIILSYEDEDGDIIEISGSTSMQDINEEAKRLLVTSQ